MKKICLATAALVVSTTTLHASSVLINDSGWTGSTDRDSWANSDFGFRYRSLEAIDYFVVDDEPFMRTRTALTTYAEPDGDEVTFTSRASVRGYLQTGAIGVEAVAGEYGRGGAVDYAFIAMKDILYFDLTSFSGTGASVTFGYTVEGDFFDNSSYLGANFSVRNVTDSNSARGVDLVYDGVPNINTFDENSIFTERLTVDVTKIAASRYEIELDSVAGVVNEVSLNSFMLARGGIFALNSAKTTVTSDFDFTSASGVFLTGEDPSVVPLPASSLLLIGGFAGLAALRRRKTS